MKSGIYFWIVLRVRIWTEVRKNVNPEIIFPFLKFLLAFIKHWL